MNDTQKQASRRYFHLFTQLVGTNSQTVKLDATNLERTNQDFALPSVVKHYRPISIVPLLGSQSRRNAEIKRSRDLTWSKTRFKTPIAFLYSRMQRPSIRTRLTFPIR